LKAHDFYLHFFSQLKAFYMGAYRISFDRLKNPGDLAHGCSL